MFRQVPAKRLTSRRIECRIENRLIGRWRCRESCQDGILPMIKIYGIHVADEKTGSKISYTFFVLVIVERSPSGPPKVSGQALNGLYLRRNITAIVTAFRELTGFLARWMPPDWRRLLCCLLRHCAVVYRCKYGLLRSYSVFTYYEAVFCTPLQCGVVLIEICLALGNICQERRKISG